ncbi:MAG: glycosyl transferase, family 2 [Candidatus Parcubacteria bacterium]|nr:glycosyl transferase, family 2 [Candidatus Parcubacteria bacterium]
MSFWKKYYYEYLNSLVNFLAPANREGCKVISDELGRVPDIQSFLEEAQKSLPADGRIIITQYSALWEPVLRLASRLGMRTGPIEQNWLSRHDLHTFARLAGLEVVKSGTKMIMPIYIPIISWLMNVILANIWPFSHMGLIHYAALRKAGLRTQARPSISIIVPARNEAGTIEKIVRDLPELGSFTEIIFIEGNSTDSTFDEIRRVVDRAADPSGKEGAAKRRLSYAKQEGKGKGDAVRKGFDMAKGDILAIYDADMTVPAHEMGKFYEAIALNKADFINGSRLVYPLAQDSMRVLNFLGNKFFSLAFSWILGEPLKDTLCGTKVLWRSDYEKIKEGRAFFGDFDPFGDFDLLFGASKLNLKIIDLPIHYQPRIYGTTNISRWRHGWLLLQMTFFAARKLKFT